MNRNPPPVQSCTCKCLLRPDPLEVTVEKGSDLQRTAELTDVGLLE